MPDPMLSIEYAERSLERRENNFGGALGQQSVTELPKPESKWFGGSPLRNIAHDADYVRSMARASGNVPVLLSHILGEMNVPDLPGAKMKHLFPRPVLVTTPPIASLRYRFSRYASRSFRTDRQRGFKIA